MCTNTVEEELTLKDDIKALKVDLPYPTKEHRRRWQTVC